MKASVQKQNGYSNFCGLDGDKAFEMNVSIRAPASAALQDAARSMRFRAEAPALYCGPARV